MLGVLLASSLVVVFGTLALRRQREELELKRELELAEALRKGDEKLARAERLATMGTFATGIAHEVSTPLGVIVGRSEQLLGRVEGDERGELTIGRNSPRGTRACIEIPIADQGGAHAQLG